MLTNEYLYGENKVPDIPEEVIVRRLAALDDNLGELLAVPYLGRDIVRIRAIQNAIRFWQNINKMDSKNE